MYGFQESNVSGIMKRFQTEEDLALMSEGVSRELMEHRLDSPGMGKDPRLLITD